VMLTQRRAVKQRRMVLDVTTALEPNLTFFTAVELADVLDMDIKIEVVPRGALAGIARPDERRGAAGSGGTGIAPVASRDARRGKARRRSGAGSASRTYGPTGGPWVARVTMASNRRRPRQAKSRCHSGRGPDALRDAMDNESDPASAYRARAAKVKVGRQESLML
jgi:hypothetical protein